MTERQLRDRVTIRHAHGYGQYKVTITFRNRYYSCYSNNSEAWDDLGKEWPHDRVYYRTDKQCLQAFYNECKRVNNLGEYGKYKKGGLK